jgi:hypothetical protein
MGEGGICAWLLDLCRILRIQASAKLAFILLETYCLFTLACFSLLYKVEFAALSALSCFISCMKARVTAIFTA